MSRRQTHFVVEDAPRRVHVAGLEVARESGLGMAVKSGVARHARG